MGKSTIKVLVFWKTESNYFHFQRGNNRHLIQDYKTKVNEWGKVNDWMNSIHEYNFQYKINEKIWSKVWKKIINYNTNKTIIY